MATKYRKKPVVIEAMQYSIDNCAEIHTWAGWPHEEDEGEFACADFGYLEIPTLEGTMRANPGDWIIKGVKGEFYPCKPEIFEATYERAEG